ncbi:extracellular solute-binding protein [Agrobacterium vitis]|uniref:extracellular solute-binding protein n=1 Tax=Rhizobium/Agrobacterium group TaxID=227290 RepID=UPI0008FB17DA|nr:MULTISPECIES: extracellular solute-binding protein [Rhizobium/Agrobacterium group]MCF1464792.1 extracellular solute-binding protein [Allorhizobium ampelinum]MCF1495338.1 extracellular solute-binding protein [Allorhizobium ampelinum]MUZ54203.1 extracellular solute-binding protein [Agrobacterium vitis]MUZ93886.1 extracellular solute-binding protein [Agrobacterium vitis]MVA41972.1 extracellular solute-binding protein [Agrobacterium vitis]
MNTAIFKKAIDRRTMLKTGTAALTTALFAPNLIRPAQAAETITLLTWETYHDDDWIAEWGMANNTDVKAVRIGSEDELFSQAFSGAVHADVLYVETGSLPRFKEANLIAKIDPAAMANTANISPSLDWKKYVGVGGETMGIPYNWGTQPLMFDAGQVTKIDTWAVLWDKAYAGKVNMFDDCTMTFPMIALYVGAKDPFNLTEAEFTACTEALKALRQQIRVIARGFDDATALYAAGDAILGYCQNVAVVSSLQAKGKNFKYSLPKEGTPTWIDCASISPQGARPIVYKFLNDNLSPEWQSRFITKSTNNGILTADAARKAGVKDDLLKMTNVPDSEAAGFWEKMVIFQRPEDLDRRLQIWNDFKSGTL